MTSQDRRPSQPIQPLILRRRSILSHIHEDFGSLFITPNFGILASRFRFLVTNFLLASRFRFRVSLFPSARTVADAE